MFWRTIVIARLVRKKADNLKQNKYIINITACLLLTLIYFKTLNCRLLWKFLRLKKSVQLKDQAGYKARQHFL